MSSQKTKTNQESETFQFGFTELEQALQDVNMDILRQQLASIANQYGFQQQAYELVPQLLDQLEGFTPSPEQQALAEQQTAAQSELLAMEMERLRSGGAATEEQKQLINAATEAQIARGTSDIEAFGREQLDVITQELAPGRGLRPSDTPIQDRAFKLGGELARQQGNLVTSLRGQQALQELNFPLAAAQPLQFQQQLAQSAGNFQDQLRQQAFGNRLNLFGTTGQLGLGLIGATQPATQLQEVFRPQLGTSSDAETRSRARGISSSVLKHQKEPINVDSILESLTHLPVERWRYIAHDDGEHIGPYAEDFKNAFGVGDGITIGYMDAIGVLMAAVQALASRVKELEDG